jgi:O-acetyl-ADP-ribose deacetylase (regulator of RNase III)
MENYNEVKGDLIDLAKKGYFDVVAHGCNCFCAMGAGIAPQMAKAFGCDTFPMEASQHSGNTDKLGTFDYKVLKVDGKDLAVVNAYTQYGTGGKPFDYIAFEKIAQDMNKVFKGKHVGLPKIGAGLAGGDWKVISDIIKKEFTDCKVTIVKYKPVKNY